MDKLKVGVVGLGQRGFASGAEYCGLIHVLMDLGTVDIVSVCDELPDRVDRVVKFMKDEHNVTVKGTTDYKELVKDPDIDAVCIFCAWEMHVPVAIAAMRAGKAVGLEVGGAYSLHDCYELVRVQEETGVPFMMLENCCYDRDEMTVMNMVRQGLFGEIVHCTGGYGHDLRAEISLGDEMNHYRLRNYRKRNCDNYPTHQLGPICKILNINRGNRMVSLSSFASKARGLNEYNARILGEDHPRAKETFAQGDIITTNIRCAGGETITLVLDTTLPRPYYSRYFTVRGTRGMYAEDTKSVIIEDKMPDKVELDWEEHEPIKDNMKDYYDDYISPIWKEYDELGITAGHGGIDWHVLNAFVDMVRFNKPSPIDVYDAAAWMCITALSEASINMGGALVEVPDFTGGKWVKVEPQEEWKYSL
ncbi:MAG: Gfo/Idh/MocA family oxidoreductase [Clostridia bacterium]|nr:Gfo/Idh/MocA family oxidoreductase [Clostridia bacterium]